MTSDPFTILVQHNHWANSVLLDRFENLTPEQLNREFPIGLKTLIATMDHIIGCVERWPLRVKQVDPGPARGEKTLAAMRARLDSSTKAVQALIEELRTAGTLGRLTTVTFPSGNVENPTATVDVTFTAGAALVHCLVHGTHHRAQALNMLRHLNLPGALPELDVMDWHHEVEGAKNR